MGLFRSPKGETTGLEKNTGDTEIMTTLTVHDIRLVKVRVALVDLGSVTKLADVVVQVPAHVLVKYGKHSVLLLVRPELHIQKQNSLTRPSLYISQFEPVLLIY